MSFVIQANWPAPKNIKAFTTTRIGGVSKTPYDSFNLATHVGDDRKAVEKNRALLQTTLQLPNEPLWLTQTHSIDVVQAELQQAYVNADASYTRQKNIVCAAQTADCLPVLICDRAATCVAAIHAGWKGLAAGIIEQTIKAMNIPGKELLVWLGPAIGPHAFEVGEDVYQQFITHDANADLGFNKISSQKWLADIYLLAKQRLHAYDVTAIYGGEFCTYTDKEKFFSFRRDKTTGRMTSLIWIED